MFELTDTLTYAVPVMLSVLVAKTVADALEPKGIYDLVIELNQLPYLDSKHEYLWGNLQIVDAVCAFKSASVASVLISSRCNKMCQSSELTQKTPLLA